MCRADAAHFESDARRYPAFFRRIGLAHLAEAPSTDRHPADADGQMRMFVERAAIGSTGTYGSRAPRAPAGVVTVLVHVVQGEHWDAVLTVSWCHLQAAIAKLSGSLCSRLGRRSRRRSGRRLCPS